MLLGLGQSVMAATLSGSHSIPVLADHISPKGNFPLEEVALCGLQLQRVTLQSVEHGS